MADLQKPTVPSRIQVPQLVPEYSAPANLPGHTDRTGHSLSINTTWLPSSCGHAKYRLAALHWHRFGFDVIPICPGGKSSAVKWDKWLAALSPSSINAYWREHPDHELGFIVGDNYIVFDADSPSAVTSLIWAECQFGVLPTIIVQTARGEHHYFRKDPSLPCRTTSKIVGEVQDRIDIKTGRTMVILPPSTGKFLVKMGAGMLEHAREITLAPQAFIAHFGALAPATGTAFPAPQVAGSTASDQKMLRIVEVGLARLDPDCDYGTWLRLGAIVFHASGGSEDGFLVFDRWSGAGSKYRGERDTRAKWKSFRLDHPNPAGMGALRYMLEAEGQDWMKICGEALDPFEPANGEGE